MLALPHYEALKIYILCRASSWGKKLESRRKKAALTDFERYKTAVAKSKKSKEVRTAFKKLKKQQA